MSNFEKKVVPYLTYLGLRPGEKLYEEKLMAEEGLKKTRNELIHMEKLSDAQIVLPRLIHATAYVSPTAEVEAGTVVLPLAIINTDCRIQSGCIINCGSIVDHGCVIEEGVHISPGTVIKAENRIPRATKIEAGEVVPLRAYPL